MKIKQSTATVLGFTVAPLTPVMVMGTFAPPTDGEWLAAFVIGAIVYLYACVFMLVIGAPTYHYFKKWNAMRWWTISLAGLIVGAAVGYVYRIPFYPDRFKSVLVQGLGCGLAGIVFWAIWRMGQRQST